MGTFQSHCKDREEESAAGLGLKPLVLGMLIDSVIGSTPS